ncbi:hypothetical protein BDR07DRAFT_1371321 [Suillus spraguei]|nr:hypothetical protein BDR07DRAFT_1371321 [Suillus spraguei]
MDDPIESIVQAVQSKDKDKVKGNGKGKAPTSAKPVPQIKGGNVSDEAEDQDLSDDIQITNSVESIIQPAKGKGKSKATTMAKPMPKTKPGKMDAPIEDIEQPAKSKPKPKPIPHKRATYDSVDANNDPTKLFTPPANNMFFLVHSFS